MTSDLDVEALLDSAANNSANRDEKDSVEPRHSDRDRDSKRRDRNYDRRRSDRDGDVSMRSPRSDRGSTHGSHSSRRRSRSPRHDRGRYRDDRDDRRGSGGDYYRGGGGRHKTRSRTPDPDRYYRPSGRDHDDRDAKRGSGREKNDHRSRTATPPLNEDERDRRTVFVQQLAARLRTKELVAFFSKVGAVKEAQIVKDRVSGRSKGCVHLPSLVLSEPSANNSTVLVT